jgi:acyl carrier protein
MIASIDVFERVVKTLRSILPKKSREADILMGTELATLGMDSLVFLEFLLGLESEFKLNLSGDVLKLKQVLTVGDAVELVSTEAAKVTL